MLVISIYLLSFIAFNIISLHYYKRMEKYLEYTVLDFAVSFIPILNTVYSIMMAIALYKNAYRD